MSATGGKVLLDRRFKGLSLLLLGGIVLMGLFIGWSEGDMQGGLAVSVIGFLITLATVVIASHLAGRGQVSRVVDDGDALVLRRVHFLDRGEIIRVPKHEIEHWRVVQRRYLKDVYSDISLQHRGRTFSFYLGADAAPDIVALEALIPEQAFSRDR